jgi:hypothetical protein
MRFERTPTGKQPYLEMLNTQHLPAGTYFLRIQTQELQQTIRFMVQH